MPVKYFKFPIMAVGLCMTAGLFVAASARAAQTVDIEIDAGRPGPVISKHLYGHGAEHNGSGNVGGMWVGRQSKIPNTKGWRKDMLAALKALHVPVLRWPAGCSADQYNWREGIGPRDGAAAGSEVGTHEFFDLVELLGAEAYVNGNAGTGSPREAAEWVEYMTAPGGSTLAQLRTKNGRSRPFKVAYFGVGHAPWGCGGNMTAQYYADLYNQFAVFIRGKGLEPPKLIASGAGAEWTDELSTKKRIRDYRDGISAHRAPAPASASAAGREGKSAEASSSELRWIAALDRALQINGFIDSNVAALDKNDAAGKISLAVAEWGGRDDAAQQQPDALGDALVAALHFHAFHAHAGRLRMASFAPAATGQALIRAEGGAMVLTPAYHAFRMHVPFQDAVSLPVRLDHNPRYSLGGIAVPAVSASAARASDGKLYLSLVNTDPKDAVEVAVGIAGAAAKGAKAASAASAASEAMAATVERGPQAASGAVLTAGAMDAHNSAASPAAVAPTPFTARSEQGKLLLTLKAMSVTVLAIDEDTLEGNRP